jgi:hypothetical protein
MRVSDGRGSSARRAPPGRGIHFGFAAAEASEPSGAFPFDQRLKRLADKARLLFQASDGLRFGHKFVVERQGRALIQPPSWAKIHYQMMLYPMPPWACSISRRNELRGAGPRGRHLACILWARFEGAEIEGME